MVKYLASGLFSKRHLKDSIFQSITVELFNIKLVKLTLIESQVQGKTADQEITSAIRKANNFSDFDLIS